VPPLLGFDNTQGMTEGRTQRDGKNHLLNLKRPAMRKDDNTQYIRVKPVA